MSPVVRPLRTDDLPEASRLHRLAFGTQFGAPDPASFRPEARPLVTRHASGAHILVAEEGGALRGSIVVADWGACSVLGPVTVDPAHWSRGVARMLLAEAVAALDARGQRLAALFTFPQSTRHIRLYQSFGFWPGALIAIMAKPVVAPPPAEVRLADPESCRRVAAAVFPGLDLSDEIAGVAAQGLGVTIGDARGFAICHVGLGSEARKDSLYVKFAAARPGDHDAFTALLAQAERLAAERGAREVTLGVSVARLGAYRALLARGYAVEWFGVALHRPEGPGWDLPDRFVIDDLR